MKHAVAVVTSLAVVVLGACAESARPAGTSETPAPPPVPQAVNGWREYPLRDGVLAIQPTKWRTDTVDVPVAAGKGLEYKLTMRKGQVVVYNVNYGAIADPSKVVSEFHGHTEKVDGVGDLMFYSKTGGTPESGVFTAPWDGVHGWYLKNDTANDLVVRLELAGYYEMAGK